jgi:hypothetical protein
VLITTYDNYSFDFDGLLLGFIQALLLILHVVQYLTKKKKTTPAPLPLLRKKKALVLIFGAVYLLSQPAQSLTSGPAISERRDHVLKLVRNQERGCGCSHSGLVLLRLWI